jgi:VWFA-related protein
MPSLICECGNRVIYERGEDAPKVRVVHKLGRTEYLLNRYNGFRMSIKLLFVCTLLVLVAYPLFAQAVPPETQPPQLTIYAHTVVEDVVVMDKTGRAVPGLHKDDFWVFENGKPQAITFFEPDFGVTEAPPQPSVPTPNAFTNIPLADAHGVTNVLLLDALDSWPEDQMYAQIQMVKYLASLPPHLQIGIFTLTPEKLNLIWPLNQDSSALTVAVAKFASSHSSKGSTTAAQRQALLSTLDETAQKTQDSRVADGAHALQKFSRVWTRSDAAA